MSIFSRMKQIEDKKPDFWDKVKDNVKEMADAQFKTPEGQQPQTDEQWGYEVGSNLVKAFSKGGALANLASSSGPLASIRSDKGAKVKIEIGKSKKPVKDFIEALKAYTYEYKEPGKHGEGEHLGVMAQDLEKAGPIGKSMVEDTEEGKQVNFAKALGAMLAIQSMHNEDIEDLKKALDSKKRK